MGAPWWSRRSVLALQADAHVDAELGALDRDGEALEGLLERHAPVRLVLYLVAGLHERVQQARDDRVLVHALNQVYCNTEGYRRLMVAIESVYHDD